MLASISHWLVGFLLLGGLLFFVNSFVRPAIRLNRQFDQALTALRGVVDRGPVKDLDHLAQGAWASAEMQHCWREYCETLHPETEVDEFGTSRPRRWRATAMAATFFTESALVDVPLRSEFFKHLPGMLTGLGIIGTFSGLILGLQSFHVSADADVVRTSLEQLLQTVGKAFMISAGAIIAAVGVTLVEKLQISRLYAKVESLCGAVDQLFDAGVGEEYLKRLVESSETSATQAQQIKDSLVNELKVILTDLTERQMQAAAQGHVQLGQVIGDAVTNSLKGPLDAISGAVQSVSGSQGDAVNRMLTDVLTSFTAQMQSMFGDQLRGMNDVLTQTARSIETASSKFDSLAAQLQTAGSDAAQAMASRVEALMEGMSQRQSEADAQMAVFMESMRDLLTRSQNESSELMLRTFKELGQASQSLADQLREQCSQAADDAQRSTREVTDSARRVIEGQGEQISALTATVREATTAMQGATERVTAAVHTNVERMGAGADRLHGASLVLEGSLKSMSDASRGLDHHAQQLQDSARLMASAAQVAQSAIQDQKAARDSFASTIQELRLVVENASREAGMTASLVQRLAAAADELQRAKQEATDYLAGVNTTLGEAHAAFASAITRTLREGNSTFHQELGAAVDMLRGAIQDLGDALEDIPARAR